MTPDEFGMGERQGARTFRSVTPHEFCSAECLERVRRRPEATPDAPSNGLEAVQTVEETQLLVIGHHFPIVQQRGAPAIYRFTVVALLQTWMDASAPPPRPCSRQSRHDAASPASED